MAATPHNPLIALAVAQDRRLKIADIRRRAQAGDITLAELMNDPPAELLAFTCLDVVTLTLSRGKARSTPMLERLGRLALRDQVNLLMPLERTSLRTRAWIAEHAAWHQFPKGGRGGKPSRLVAVDTDAA